MCAIAQGSSDFRRSEVDLGRHDGSLFRQVLACLIRDDVQFIQAA